MLKPDLAVGSVGKVVVFRLKPGMKLFETIEWVMEQNGIDSAVIVNGVGAIKEARIRNLVAYAEKFPIGDKERQFVDTKGPLELLSLQGSISRKRTGEMFVHGHGVFCGVQPAGSAFGGHLVEAEVYSTTEVTLAEVLDIKLTRAICPESGGLELKPVNE